MAATREYIECTRDAFIQSYKAAEARNRRSFLSPDIAERSQATDKYIFPNQQEDAHNIVNFFHQNRNVRIVSIKKRTKIGANGLIIDIVKNMCTHIDDDFVVMYDNVRIITGMSNTSWQRELKKQIPQCCEECIFHHGKLHKADLNIKNGLIIIDEIDTGDGINQVLDRKLKDVGVLNIDMLRKNNNRLVVISATMKSQLDHLKNDWGDLHISFKMTVPDEYISHKEFLDKGIIQEFYPVKSSDAAEKWIKEDILDNYGLQDTRINLIRIDEKNVQYIKDACYKLGIDFLDHTSDNRINDDDLNKLFNNRLQRHTVIAIKGFYMRADLINDHWKLRIGATHEKYVKDVNYDVQIQGLPGRMTGYWKAKILAGHKTGPYRTSVKAVKEYEFWYNDGDDTFYTTKSKQTMLAGSNVKGLEEKIVAPKSKYNVTQLFNTDYELEQHLIQINKPGSKYNLSESNTIQLRNEPKPIYTYETEAQFKTLDIYWGINETTLSRRMPVIHKGKIQYIGIYLDTGKKDISKVLSTFTRQIDITKDYNLNELKKILTTVYKKTK